MISIVIPTLNAARELPRALAPLIEGAARGFVKQVVVCDGGSEDDTLDIADAAGCDIVTSARGRGTQLRAGAAAAKADWLLFLHADTVLGAGWIEASQAFITAPGSHERAAAFRLAFDDDSPAARRVVFWARQRARFLKLPYGDQGLLISRTFYDAIGGFAEIPLMEDIDIVRRIGPRRMRLLDVDAVTSAEKFRRDGYQKRAWRNMFLATRFLLGADPRELAKAYD